MGTAEKHPAFRSSPAAGISRNRLPLVLPAEEDTVPDLRPGVVHIWSCPLDGPMRHAHTFRAVLSPEEQAIASRFHSPRLAERYCRAHGWVRVVLSRYLALAPERLRLDRDPGGKPRLACGSLHFNLSHSESLCVLAVRQCGPVGVDVEALRSVPEAMAIARRWFSAPEIRWISRAGEPGRAFLRCWVCREAWLKARGTGLGQPLDSFALQPRGNALHLEGASLMEWNPLVGYVAAVVCI